MFRRFILISVLVCASGEKLLRLEGKIFGARAVITDFPYQVSIEFKGKHICGGSIISERVILTAANCMLDRPTRDFKIKAGSTDISNGGVRIAARDIIVHEYFNDERRDNDIALMLLAKKLSFTNSIQSVPLAKSREEIKAGTIAYTSGWGLLVESEVSPKVLTYIAINLIDTQKCNEKYEDTNFRISESMICAGTPEGGKDACQKDLGGPLVSKETLVGIVSWGLGCGHKDYPGVYTRVSYYRDWIEKNRPDK